MFFQIILTFWSQKYIFVRSHFWLPCRVIRASSCASSTLAWIQEGGRRGPQGGPKKSKKSYFWASGIGFKKVFNKKRKKRKNTKKQKNIKTTFLRSKKTQKMVASKFSKWSISLLTTSTSSASPYDSSNKNYSHAALPRYAPSGSIFWHFYTTRRSCR